MESGDPFDPRAPRSPRREQRDTERLDSGNHAEPVNPAWRRTRSAGRQPRGGASFPQELSLWLQYDGWKFVLAAIAIVLPGLCSSFSVNRMHRGRCPPQRPNRSRRSC